MATEQRGDLISMHLLAADLAVIDQAARLCGRDRLDFVRDVVVDAAEAVVATHQTVRMTPDGFAEFINILSRPAAPVPEMVALAQRPAPWELVSGQEA